MLGGSGEVLGRSPRKVGYRSGSKLLGGHSERLGALPQGLELKGKDLDLLFGTKGHDLVVVHKDDLVIVG